ncbi:MAG TPA: glycosyltransferase family 39 protein [Chthoniobacterales bacterium]|jgi:4-amino-4-deoxy-L-arabinose transferase-like glycosyltransferase
MSRVANLFLVVVIWAAVYLPALGSLEIKGEEGRRILPAITMLDTGDYLVPQVGSEPYYRKPPLVNWLVAASFKLSGYRNEWTARLPSALSVLTVALAFVIVARASLGANGSLIAALIWLTNFGMIEKGRLIEIEALYVSLFGLAMICWLSWWRQRRSSWLTWTVPWIFLGLGLLAKGPLHLLFFYAVVVSVLYCAGEIREIWRPAHWAGIAIMLGIFAVWAVPYWRALSGANIAQTWSVQLTGRLTGDDFTLSHWLLNIPRGLAYFLPWTLALPLVRGVKFSAPLDRNVSRALSWGCAIPFFVVNVLPGALPRYSMPALVPASWLLAMTLAAGEIKRPAWWPSGEVPGPQRRATLVFYTAIASGLAMCLFALAVVPILQRRSKVKPIAAQIDALIPGEEPLYAIDPDFQPFLFYLKARLIYVSRPDDLPLSARYLLFQPEKEPEIVASQRWSPLHAHPITSLEDYRNRRVILARIEKENKEPLHQ